MRSFTEEQIAREIPGGLAWLLGSVMECRGRQELYEQRSPEVLEALTKGIQAIIIGIKTPEQIADEIQAVKERLN